MVSIYGRMYDVIHVEINSSGQNSRGLPQPQQSSHLDYFFIYMVIVDLTSWQNTENSKQTDTSENVFNVAGEPSVFSRTGKLSAAQLAVQFCFHYGFFLADAESRLMPTPWDMCNNKMIPWQTAQAKGRYSKWYHLTRS